MSGFITIPIENGLLHTDDDGNFRTLVSGFAPGGSVALPADHTHLGIVISGTVELRIGERVRVLQEGDFFSAVGEAHILSKGKGMISSASDYRGLNVFGGPIEAKGRLRYIDGCTDTLLVPPVRKGDPCLNHLHFPKGITQTPHTHPSVRTGIVLRGRGECVVPNVGSPVPLVPGYAFIITTNAVHSFNTADQEMDVIAFHPDSDTGMSDDDHPMVNRTMVDGVSARQIDAIRTR